MDLRERTMVAQENGSSAAAAAAAGGGRGSGAAAVGGGDAASVSAAAAAAASAASAGASAAAAAAAGEAEAAVVLTICRLSDILPCCPQCITAIHINTEIETLHMKPLFIQVQMKLHYNTQVV